MRKCESEKHKSWSMPAEGFKDQVATDGSLLEKRWQVGSMWLGSGTVDYNEETRPLHGMYSSMEAESEVQRTIKRAELTPFFVLPQKSMWTHQDSCGQQGNN